MLVSIIVPIYNAEKFLDKCLQSLRKQTYSNFEAILINDGSTDQSQKICERYAKIDQRFTIICQSNSGVSAARNLGLDLVHGEKVLFIDADDYVEESYISSLMYHNQNDLVVMGVSYINSPRKLAPPTTHFTMNDSHDENLLEQLLLNNYFTAPWAKLFSTSIIRDYQIRYNPQLFIGEDTVFILEYLRHVSTIQCISLFEYHFYDVRHKELMKYALPCKKYQTLVSVFSKCVEQLQASGKMQLIKFYQHMMTYYGKLFFAHLIHVTSASLLENEIKYFKSHQMVYIPDSSKKKWVFRSMLIAPRLFYKIITYLRPKSSL